MFHSKYLFILQVFFLVLQEPCILLLNGQPSCPNNLNTWNRTQIVSSLYSGNEALYRSQTDIYINLLNITNFDSGSFANLSSLVTLNLNENLITCLLDANLFSTGTTSLKELFLGSNLITSLNQNQFKGLKNLKTLGLSSNRLSSFVSNIFIDLTSLEDLDLRDNLLTSLSSTSFNTLTKLKSLSLCRNKLTTLSATIFSKLANLESLYLCV
jgi:Leucine-rich repeat (LRR) protein